MGLAWGITGGLQTYLERVLGQSYMSTHIGDDQARWPFR
jgi:hypothetical protein